MRSGVCIYSNQKGSATIWIRALPSAGGGAAVLLVEIGSISGGISDEQTDTAEGAAERGQTCSSGRRSSVGRRRCLHRSTQVDFSSRYDINSHFSIHGRFKEQVLDGVDCGRRFPLGVHAKWQPAEVRCRGRPHGVAAPFGCCNLAPQTQPQLLRDCKCAYTQSRQDSATMAMPTHFRRNRTAPSCRNDSAIHLEMAVLYIQI